MAFRNIGKITADLKKAAQRVEKMRWRKPIVMERIRTARDKPAPKGVSVQAMFRAALPAVIDAVTKGDVHIIRRQKRVQRGQLTYWFMTSTSEKGVARQHVQTIKVKDKAAKLYQSKDLFYECDCGYWKYYCDWAAWKKGASELKHSTDEPPDEKNPSYKVMPCKHLRVVCSEVLEQRL